MSMCVFQFTKQYQEECSHMHVHVPTRCCLCFFTFFPGLITTLPDTAMHRSAEPILIVSIRNTVWTPMKDAVIHLFTESTHTNTHYRNGEEKGYKVPVSQLVLAVGVTGLMGKGNKPSPAPEKHTGLYLQISHRSETLLSKACTVSSRAEIPQLEVLQA